MEKVFIIYHKVDLDGLFGAWACGYPYEFSKKGEEIIYVPMNYGDELPTPLEDMKGHMVYIVDFSLPPEQMERLNENADLYWFDHHISAIKDNEHLNIKGKRDTSVAGCFLAFYNHPKSIGNIRPVREDMIKFISDYDTWNHNSENSWDEEILPFQYAMRAEIGLDLKRLKKFMIELPVDTDAVMHNMIIIGKVIIQSNKQNWEQWMKKSGDMEIEGLKGLALFGPSGGNSQVFESKRDNTKYDIMVYITYNITKKEYSVSLYTDKEDVDCSVIAKTFGGGGHKKASGFVCKELPFNI